ncbi:hypothetical protein AVEN_83865-1 [Araneus ventricosus]|uniref:PiggyBac transposable element-derived protein domain-containing protein n=1 Tax=Araneus ventricosus TaxID=182803 RepID=A0A4Y2C2Z1_ARAVE|nr:hypothetical protein AVEN_248887-1 [Araneus ventricosus]GBN58718.1 hypothetical protein AVEN_83865-1 [Araneus ventricosus]
MYAIGLYGAKSSPLNTLWSTVWGPPFFSQTTARDRFKQKGVNLTVDDQLLPSKARCPFTQYIPSKPDKFLIKFWLLVSVDSKYVLNGFPYTAADSERPADQSVHEYVAMQLTQPSLGKGRNVTTSSYFCIVKLCERLKSQSRSLVGTLRRDRVEMPPTAKLEKQNLDSTILYRKDKDIF